MEKVKFEQQETPDHVWVVAFDTICTGWDAWKSGGDGEIALYTSEEADEELKEEGNEDCFKVHMNDYVHGRKTIFTSEGGHIEGTKPEK